MYNLRKTNEKKNGKKNSIFNGRAGGGASAPTDGLGKLVFPLPTCQQSTRCPMKRKHRTVQLTSQRDLRPGRSAFTERCFLVFGSGNRGRGGRGNGSGSGSGGDSGGDSSGSRHVWGCSKYFPAAGFSLVVRKIFPRLSCAAAGNNL